MQIIIQRVRERPVFDVMGDLVPWMEIDFTIGRHGPFTIKMPKDEFTQEAAIEKIKKEYQHIIGLVSEFEV